MIHLFYNLIAQTAQAETAVSADPAVETPDPHAELFLEHRGSYWFPEQASEFAPDIDSAFMLIFWVSAIFFFAIVTAMTVFVLKYRQRPGHKVEKSPSHNTALEIAWSVLPGFLLAWFFIDGARGFFEQRVVPADCEQINVVAKQYDWSFYYPDGDATPQSEGLHLVRNRPV
jgi:cytochrome c oxidase subunit 2